MSFEFPCSRQQRDFTLHPHPSPILTCDQQNACSLRGELPASPLPRSSPRRRATPFRRSNPVGWRIFTIYALQFSATTAVVGTPYGPNRYEKHATPSGSRVPPNNYYEFPLNITVFGRNSLLPLTAQVRVSLCLPKKRHALLSQPPVQQASETPFPSTPSNLRVRLLIRTVDENERVFVSAAIATYHNQCARSERCSTRRSRGGPAEDKRDEPEGNADAHEDEQAAEPAVGRAVLRSEGRAELQRSDHAPESSG